MARIPVAQEVLGQPIPSAKQPFGFTKADAALLSAPFDVNIQREQANAREAESIGQFGQAMAGATEKLGDAYTKAKQQDEDYEVTRALLNFSRDQERGLDEARHNMAPGAVGFAAGVRTAYDDGARSLFGDLRTRGMSDYGLRRLDEKLRDWGEKFETKAWHAELQERDRFHTEDVMGTLADLTNRAASRPERLEDHIAAGRTLIESSKIPNVRKAQLALKFPQQVEEYAVRSLIAQGKIDEALKILSVRPTDEGGSVAAPIEGAASVRVSDDGLAFLRSMEGFKGRAYVDGSQVSNGYGTRARHPGEVIDRPEAERRMREHVAGIEARLGEVITVPLSRSQHDALISFFYNVGPGKGETTLNTIAGLINDGRVDEVGDYMKRFVYGDPERSGEKRKLDALVTRRNAEARMFARGATENPEDSKPGVVGDVDDAGDPITYKVADDARLRYLTPKQRSTLINVARTSMRANTDQALKDEVERIRRTGDDTVANDVLARAATVMTRNQMEKYKIAIGEARMEYDAIAPLSGMNPEQAATHLERIAPSNTLPEESYKSRAKVFDKAVKAWERIEKERAKDPAMAVAAAPELRTIYGRINAAGKPLTARLFSPDGTPSGALSADDAPVDQVKQWKMVFEARKEAQSRLGLQDYEQKIVTLREAKDLLRLPADPSKMTDKAYREALAKAADRAHAAFGPEYAARAFEDALNLTVRGKPHDDWATTVVNRLTRKAAFGEKPSAEDMWRLTDLGDISRLDRIFKSPVVPPMETDRPMISPLAAPGVTASWMAKDASDAATKLNRKPTAAQTNWLNEDYEARARAYDREFGPGAAARDLKK